MIDLTPDSKNIQSLLDLMTAYQRSRVLFTFVELEIPKILSREKLSAPQIARIKKINPLAMERFLNAAVSIGLLKIENDIYSNSDMTESFLVKEKEFYLGGQVNRQRRRSSKVWTQLTGHLKKWEYGNGQNPTPDTEDQGAEAMTEQHNLALFYGTALAKAFDFSKHKKILDLGGGSGASSIALCQKFPHLKSIVFDLPENVPVAEMFIRRSGLQNRIEIIGGDLKKDDLPGKFDAVLLANFMSVADADANKALLGQIYKKLPAAGGAIILSGWIIDNSHLAPQISVLFCLEDICWNAPDVERDERVYTKWLSDAGFENIECRTYLEPAKVLYGFKL